jgi:hypothetical protein
MDASDNTGVKYIDILVDGVQASQITNLPYEFQWSCAGKLGTHTIKANAYDDALNKGESEIISFTVIERKKNILTGYVKNSLNTPIEGAILKCLSIETQTNTLGYFELIDIPTGTQEIAISAENYNSTTQTLFMPEGSKSLNVQLTSSTITSLVNLRYIKGSYSITINWDPINLNTLLGYNIYYRKTFVWTQGWNGAGYYRFNPDWTKINAIPLTSLGFIHNNLEEYNTFYSYYVLPVNVDGIETPFVEGTTNILEVPGISNNQQLYDLDINNLASYNVPNITSAYIILWIIWHYVPQDVQLTSWNLYLSTDNINWQKIKTFGLVGTGDVYMEGEIRFDFDLESYKGETIYLKYDGAFWGSINLFTIQQFNR